MRVAEHNKSLSDGLRVLGLSAVELYFMMIVYILLHFVVSGFLSLASFVVGYFVCRAFDAVEPHFLESALMYLAQPRLVRKR
jgi:type IV secretory pathway VirB3-like protein